MLTSEQLNSIYSNNPNKWRWRTSTIAYALSIKDNNHSIVYHHNAQDANIFVVIFWFLFNRFIILCELWNLRRTVTKLMFCDCPLGFSVGELNRVVKNPANQWLDYRPTKLEQFAAFCMDLLNDDSFANDVCNRGSITRKKYRQILLNAIRVFTTSIDDCNSFDKKRRELERAETRFMIGYNLSDKEGEEHTKLYSQNFEDTSLLEESEANH